jgi:PKD repeat protein
MKTLFTRSIIALCLLTVFGFTKVKAQLFIDPSYTIDTLVGNLYSGSCGAITNITHIGDSANISYFDAGGTSLGINAGIFLSSGRYTDVANPATFTLAEVLSLPGDTSLENLLSMPIGLATSYDAAILEFDLQAGGDTMKFNYVFASEEYPEFVCTAFNDVFGFLITGPKPSGGFYQEENIALIPSTNIPVSINTVNGGVTSGTNTPCILTNTAYYVDAALDTMIAFDGRTIPLNAYFAAVPGATYHCKIGVTDIGDGTLDSGVFLGVESLCGDSILSPIANFIYYITNKTDETSPILTVEDKSVYGKRFFWDFGDGSTSYLRNPAPHTYTTPGTYNVTYVVSNFCCTDTFRMVVDATGGTGINSLPAEAFVVSPNPVQNVMMLNTPLEGDYNVLVTDMNGRKVYENTFNKTMKLNVSDYVNGVYFMQISNGTGSISKRFIKN